MSLSTGAWLQLRDALDYADTERFPTAQFGESPPSIVPSVFLCLSEVDLCRSLGLTENTCFLGGPATRKNTARLQRIVQEFSPMGAIVEDVAAASGSRHFSRSRKGRYNLLCSDFLRGIAKS